MSLDDVITIENANKCIKFIKKYQNYQKNYLSKEIYTNFKWIFTIFIRLIENKNA